MSRMRSEPPRVVALAGVVQVRLPASGGQPAPRIRANSKVTPLPPWIPAVPFALPQRTQAPPRPREDTGLEVVRDSVPRSSSGPLRPRTVTAPERQSSRAPSRCGESLEPLPATTPEEG